MAELLPIVQLAHNVACLKTLTGSPHFLVCGRLITLFTDGILGAQSIAAFRTRLGISCLTVATFQLAYDLTCRNLTEHNDRQASPNEKLPVTNIPLERKCLITAHTLLLMSNHNLTSSWPGPFHSSL